MKKFQTSLVFLLTLSSLFISCNFDNSKLPLNLEKEEHNPDKKAIWTPEQAARHQQILATLTEKSDNFTKKNMLNLLKTQRTLMVH